MALFCTVPTYPLCKLDSITVVVVDDLCSLLRLENLERLPQEPVIQVLEFWARRIKE